MTSQAGTQRTWIITGASSGFGRAIAECAVGRGDNVVLAVRRPGSVADLADAHRDQVLIAEFDVRDTGRAGDVVQAAVERFGRVAGRTRATTPSPSASTCCSNTATRSAASSRS
ncbi:SDR family NAD(P)-dependent oxidoreductase [Actinomadura luteofluorescens]|uniref:NADP-dependent 3-hydroxy acid dehydrogenase YdfG n=1 Tax=Actinomadura luteofluorescens TaxID=46163 RepID=A0A7Y9JJ49_9ACTN|nr:SDR family NAD(P)-dependent oxidoreductase [Actinomadura luteofluorescens]NYD50496.1 NADP-dependent 3-hydroxy acid dehydrogenase YdfG [Actinomadura luteofluorescens]